MEDFPPLINPVDKMGIQKSLNNFKYSSNKLPKNFVDTKLAVTVNNPIAKTETYRKSKQILRPKAKNCTTVKLCPVSNIGSSLKYVPKTNMKNCSTVSEFYTVSTKNFFDLLSISETDKKKNCYYDKMHELGEIPHEKKNIIPANHRLHNINNKRTSLYIQAFGKSLTFNTFNKTISISSLKSFVEKHTGIKKKQQHFRLKNGLTLSTMKPVICEDGLKIDLYQPGLGGVKGSNFHPERECGPCRICQKHSIYSYRHLLKNEQSDMVINYIQQNYGLIENDCICKACFLKSERAASSKRNEQDVPIIKKKKVQCMLHSLEMCSPDISHLRPSPISLDKINSVFDTNVTDYEGFEIFLCDSHFMKATRFESSHDKCNICNSVLKRKYKLRFDKMDKLLYYFQDKNLTPVDLSKNSDICKQCFSSITNFFDSDAFVEILSREKITDILTKASNSSLPIYFDNNSTKCFEKLVIKICNDLLEKKALLISDIVQCYKDFGGNFISDQLRNQNRLLCNKLNTLFGDSIICKYNRQGTIILMKGLNIVSCLIDSLAELKKFKTCTSHDENTLEEKVQIDDANVLKKAAEIIKLKIQISCKNIKNSSNRNLSNFKFHNFIENTIDPILWNFLCALIGQETELQLPFGENSISDDSVQFSQIFNICCCLIYNRDSKCNKFQMLIADIIDKFTNSFTDCFNLLNKFGICVSKQTYERYQTHIVEERKSNSINSSKCQFQIASVDNINKRSSYSAVKSTDAHRGFDGTSIQLVIPKPSIELLPEEKQQYLKGNIYLYGKDEYRSVNLFQDNDSKDISLYNSIAILMNYGLLTSERDNDGICTSDIEKIMENCLTNTVMDQSLREILSDPYYLSDENFSKVSKFSPDEHINHELYLFNTRREADLVDLAAVSFATGCCIYIYEINTNNPLNQNHLLLKKKINPMFLTNHSFHIMEVDGKYCPLINHRLYFDSGIFLMSKNITDVSDFRKYNGFHKKLSSIAAICTEVKKDSEIQQFARNRKRKPEDLYFFNQSTINLENFVNKVTLEHSNHNRQESNLKKNFNVNDFEKSETEIAVAQSCASTFFEYCFCKLPCPNSHSQSPGIQDFISEKTNNTLIEKSEVKYLSLLDEQCDNKDTVKHSLEILHQNLNVGQDINHLVVVGDGKTYDLLVKLKGEYGSELDWVLPFPGDWHILKNYQRMLMKLYLDAGLKDFIEIFHQGATANSVIQAVNFDKTHNFLLQFWESLFRFQIETVIKYFHFNHEQNDHFIHIKRVSDILSDDTLSPLEKIQKEMQFFQNFSVEYEELLGQLCEENENWRFWNTFLSKHCFTYIAYFLAIRSGNWELRNFCIKEVTKITQITESKYYARLLPYHIVDLKNFPASIIKKF
ncbi:unnamed protein product [Mytilus coruscus]|uniref:Ubiquitin-like domain-containing protein n=1 Tax=Mytilus coruscus TaxID=42192 RepID=A0A6J8DX35_MYTCO|nr:unnamed protein product [Mytilus coruscus]